MLKKLNLMTDRAMKVFFYWTYTKGFICNENFEFIMKK